MPASDGGYLPFAALTAIHYVHRLGAYVVLVAMALLAWRLRRERPAGAAALGAGVCAVWRCGSSRSGLSNVVLGWPLVGAVAHTGGAAALVVSAGHAADASAQTGTAARPSASAAPGRCGAAP